MYASRRINMKQDNKELISGKEPEVWILKNFKSLKGGSWKNKKELCVMETGETAICECGDLFVRTYFSVE